MAKKKAPAKKAKAPAKKTKPAKSAAKPAVKAKPVEKKSAAVMKPIINLDLQPLDDRLVVEVLAHETKTAGGLFIPDMALDQNAPLRGKVVSVGRGRKNKKGMLRPMDVSKGDTVMFPRFAGTPIKMANRDLCILREAEILGIVES